MMDKKLAIQKSPAKKSNYNKYSYALKRKIVYEVEKGQKSIHQAKLEYGIKGNSLIYAWIKKYGLLNYEPDKEYKMKQSPQEKIKELLNKIEQLELEKDIFFDISEAFQEQGVDVKKFLPEQLKKEFLNRLRKAK